MLFFSVSAQASEECSKSQFNFDKRNKEFQFLICPQNITYQGRFEMGEKFIVDEVTYQDQFFLFAPSFEIPMNENNNAFYSITEKVIFAVKKIKEKNKDGFNNGFPTIRMVRPGQVKEDLAWCDMEDPTIAIYHGNIEQKRFYVEERCFLFVDGNIKVDLFELDGALRVVGNVEAKTSFKVHRESEVLPSGLLWIEGELKAKKIVFD